MNTAERRTSAGATAAIYGANEAKDSNENIIQHFDFLAEPDAKLRALVGAEVAKRAIEVADRGRILEIAATPGERARTFGDVIPGVTHDDEAVVQGFCVAMALAGQPVETERAEGALEMMLPLFPAQSHTYQGETSVVFLLPHIPAPEGRQHARPVMEMLMESGAAAIGMTVEEVLDAGNDS